MSKPTKLKLSGMCIGKEQRNSTDEESTKMRALPGSEMLQHVGWS
jgi:hypothetical protein